jgi:hypothetical protein
VAVERLRLGDHVHRMLAQRRARVGEEELTYGAQAFERVVAAIIRSVAVGPFVVADGVYERVAESVEPLLDHVEVLVAA